MRNHAILVRLDDDEKARADKLARKRKIDGLQTYLRTLIEEDAQAAGMKASELGPERRTRLGEGEEP